MGLLKRLADSIDRLNGVLGRSVSWLALLMILVGAYNAIVRTLDKYGLTEEPLSSNTLLEAQWYLFSALFLGAAAWTLEQDAHVRVDVLYGRLGERGRAWIDLLGTLLFLLPFCGYAIWTSWPIVVESWRILEPSSEVGGLPRYPIKTLIPVAFALVALQGLSLACRKVLVLLGEPPSEASGAEEGTPEPIGGKLPLPAEGGTQRPTCSAP